MQRACEGAAAQQLGRLGALVDQLEQRARDLVEGRLLILVRRVASEVPWQRAVEAHREAVELRAAPEQVVEPLVDFLK